MERYSGFASDFVLRCDFSLQMRTGLKHRLKNQKENKEFQLKEKTLWQFGWFHGLGTSEVFNI